jgi:hypothetical protein
MIFFIITDGLSMLAQVNKYEGTTSMGLWHSAIEVFGVNNFFLRCNQPGQACVLV